MITCPKGHSNVQQTGSVRSSVGEIIVTSSKGRSIVIPAHENVTLHYTCQVCGARFSAKPEDKR